MEVPLVIPFSTVAYRPYGSYRTRGHYILPFDPHIIVHVKVAPITSAIRGAPSEVIVGVDEGLKHDSAINLDHVQTVDKARLERFVGTIGSKQMNEVCRALAIATGCSG